MEVVSFIWQAKYGHFLRAEANVNALTYPLPPRTAIIGLLGAMLGLEKDSPQHELLGLKVAITGSPPQKFWHRVKLRKDPPTALPYTVKAKDKGSESSKPEKAALINQEWLWKPSFLISVALPTKLLLFTDLVNRLQNQQWHFSLSMGLSELLAQVEYQELSQAQNLPEGEYEIDSICPQNLGELRAKDNVAIYLLRMPVNVDKERVFKHESLYLERHGKPIKIHTSHAWQVGNRKLVFF
ncbi:MAG: CRISPR-associated protein Cas5 [Acidobacteria bacterium]|nr:CRISPR-associated protein Cas5 [Acidobacteriota bacterium]